MCGYVRGVLTKYPKYPQQSTKDRHGTWHLLSNAATHVAANGSTHGFAASRCDHRRAEQWSCCCHGLESLEALNVTSLFDSCGWHTMTYDEHQQTSDHVWPVCSVCIWEESPRASEFVNLEHEWSTKQATICFYHSTIQGPGLSSADLVSWSWAKPNVENGWKLSMVDDASPKSQMGLGCCGAWCCCWHRYTL